MIESWLGFGCLICRFFNLLPTIRAQTLAFCKKSMFEAPVPGTKSGDIIEVSSEGFVLHDRLLRPAHVGVSSNS